MGKFGRSFRRKIKTSSPQLDSIPAKSYTSEDYAQAEEIIKDIVRNYGESFDTLNKSFEVYRDHPLFGLIRSIWLDPESDIFSVVGDLYDKVIEEEFSSGFDFKALHVLFTKSLYLHPVYKELVWEKLLLKSQEHGEDTWTNILKFGLKYVHKDPEALKEVENARVLLSSVEFPSTDTASNFESLMIHDYHLRRQTVSETVSFVVPSKGSILERNLKKLAELYRRPNYLFADLWAESGFSRIEIGHKLAAALCLTNVPDDVPSPWEYWSLMIPNGLFETELTLENEKVLGTEIERIWCKGSEIYAILYKFDPARLLKEEHKKEFLQTGMTPFYLAHQIDESFNPDTVAILKNLVRSVCLCVNDKSSDRKGNWGKGYIARRKSDGGGKLDVSGERYVIGRPVSIDLRQDLSNYMSRKSRNHESPKFQFLVRGHWRNQRFGKNRSESRLQWIEPFWKGHEGMTSLLKIYNVKTGSNMK